MSPGQLVYKPWGPDKPGGRIVSLDPEATPFIVAEFHGEHALGYCMAAAVDLFCACLAIQHDDSPAGVRSAKRLALEATTSAKAPKKRKA